MPISGVVVLTKPELTHDVLNELQKREQITTYGVHKEYNIVAIFEADSAKGLGRIADDINENIPGVLGVFPAYINFENDE